MDDTTELREISCSSFEARPINELSMCKNLKSGQVVIWDKLNDGKESYEQVKRD